MPCISLWYNSCAIDTRERYIVKIVFEVNGKKVPLKSLKYISKKDQLEVMKNWFFENFEIRQMLVRMKVEKVAMLTYMAGRMMRAKNYNPSSVNMLNLSILRN
ncbi:Uncharacterised protein [Escherichia coli]|uniref:Uncharacterized protein n=1 Tax=Escherichia coli TaxID=562 RepID=A0A484X5W5_ECOLX|nr:Uncharacterised protein [Escherichia coli]